MGSIEHSVFIAASPEVVWRIYADPARIPEWQTGSPVIVDQDGDGMSPGASYTSRRGRLAARTSVVDADPPRRLETHTDAYFGLSFDAATFLTADDGGTRLRVAIRTSWPRGLHWPGRLVERAILSGREAAKELAHLKTLAEREAGS